MKLTNKWTNRRSWQDTVPGARWTYIILALKVALNSALISAWCFTALTETTFAPKPEVALRVYCVAVRSAILATAWLLVTLGTRRRDWLEEGILLDEGILFDSCQWLQLWHPCGLNNTFTQHAGPSTSLLCWVVFVSAKLLLLGVRSQTQTVPYGKQFKVIKHTGTDTH